MSENLQNLTQKKVNNIINTEIQNPGTISKNRNAVVRPSELLPFGIKAKIKDINMHSFKAGKNKKINSNDTGIGYTVTDDTLSKNRKYENTTVYLNLTEKERESKIKNSRSRLYAKHKNAKLLEKNVSSFNERINKHMESLNKALNDKKCLEDLEAKGYSADIFYPIFIQLHKSKSQNPGKEEFSILQKLAKADKKQEEEIVKGIIDSFMKQSFQFNMKNDADVAANANRLEQYAKYHDALFRMAQRFRDVPISLNKEYMDKFYDKLEDLSKLIGFYRAKKELMTNEYYKRHYDYELDANYYDDDNENAQITNGMMNAVKAWEGLITGNYSSLSEAVNKTNSIEKRKTAILATSLLPMEYQTRNERNKESHGLLTLIGVAYWKIRNFFKKDVYSKKHGSVNYDESLRKLAYIPKQLKDLSKGEEYKFKHYEKTPEVEINKYFDDEFKRNVYRTLHSRLNYPNGVLDKNNMNLARALEALDAYLETNGIVNTDTVEMEMSFLDVFFKESAVFLHEERERYGQSDEYRIIENLVNDMKEYTGGSLKRTVESENPNAEENDFEFAKKHAITIERSVYKSDSRASNIKDIPLFLHQPSINDVKQSSVGDCWLLAAVTSIIRRSPDSIRKMFQDLGDGRVMIRLYDAVGTDRKRISSLHNYKGNVFFKPVYVVVNKQYETGDGNASDCPWLQLLERAYAACGFNKHTSKIKNGRLTGLVSEISAGVPTDAIMHLLGQGRPNQFEEIDMEDKESLALNEGDYSEILDKDENKEIINIDHKKYREKSYIVNTFINVRNWLNDGDTIIMQNSFHCLNCLDVKVENRTLWFLIREPFNTYHRSYGNFIEEPFGRDSLNNMFKANAWRKLSKSEEAKNNPYKNVHRGFRGCSWWKGEDILKNLVSITRVPKLLNEDNQLSEERQEVEFSEGSHELEFSEGSHELEFSEGSHELEFSEDLSGGLSEDRLNERLGLG